MAKYLPALAANQTAVRADDMFRMLNGIFVIYKPQGAKLSSFYTRLRLRLAQSLLDDFPQRPCNQLVAIEPVRKHHHISSGGIANNNNFPVVPKTSHAAATETTSIQNEKYEIKVVQDYADHPCVVGPRFCAEEIQLNLFDNELDEHTSGILPVAVGREGRWDMGRLRHTRPMCVYQIEARMGMITSDNFITSRIQHRIDCGRLTRHMLETKLIQLNSMFRIRMLHAAKIDPQSQLAYEAMARGFVRPDDRTEPVIYMLKCIGFRRPYFKLEIHCVNASTALLARVVHDIGAELKVGATVQRLHRIRVGPLTLEHALTQEQWNVAEVMEMSRRCRPAVRKMFELQNDLFFGDYVREVEQNVRTTETLMVHPDAIFRPK